MNTDMKNSNFAGHKGTKGEENNTSQSFTVAAEGLTKEYHIYDSPADRFKELFLKTRKHRVFRAIGPVDFSVKRGEAFGIIGDNGAGKSTLLKMVAGVIKPTSGNLYVNGKVSSILELGTGFHPEFTGRDNVILNASFHGIQAGEIKNRMDGIISFADIGEFFDLPVKYYSSGMYMRLAFSLAVHVNADILVVDEALAVGDGAYMKKCIDKIWEIKNRGVIIFFCSHSLYTVANFCERTMWIKKGSIAAIGETKEVVSRYEDYLREKQSAEKSEMPVLVSTPDRKVAKVRGIRLVADGREIEGSVLHSSNVEVVVDFEVFEDKAVYVGFAVDRNDGLCCYADTMLKQGVNPFQGPGVYSTKIFFRNLPLLGSAYKFVIFLLDEIGICVFDREESQIFKVDTEQKEWGVCYLPHEWKR